MTRTTRTWMLVTQLTALLGSVLASAQSDATATDGARGASEQVGDTEFEAEEREARMLFELARRYYDTGRFADAGDAFQRAYDLVQLPQLLYNAYLAHREAGNLEAAEVALAAYVPTVEGDTRRAAESRLEGIRRLRGQFGASTDTGSESARDDEPRSDEAGGGGQQAGGDAAAPRPPVTGAPDTGRGAEASDGGVVAPWVVLGAGGALLLASAVTGAFALSADADLDSQCGPGGCPPGLESRQARGRALAISTDVLWVSGAFFAVTGLLWGVLASRTSRRDTQIAGGCSVDGCGLVARRRF